MSDSDWKALLGQLFDAERTARQRHDELAGAPLSELLPIVEAELAEALELDDEDESTLRLVRIAGVLGELEGPRVVDGLIDILGAEHPEARGTAGEHLEDLAFTRFKEVAEGIQRALKRLPEGSPALPELPYLLIEIPEPGVVDVLKGFLAHDDPDAVAAAIEAIAEIGDPSAKSLLEALTDDARTVELADDASDQTEEITIGDLASDAIELLDAAAELKGTN